MKYVTVIKHPLVQHNLTRVRDYFHVTDLGQVRKRAFWRLMH